LTKGRRPACAARAMASFSLRTAPVTSSCTSPTFSAPAWTSARATSLSMTCSAASRASPRPAVCARSKGRVAGSVAPPDHRRGARAARASSPERKDPAGPFHEFMPNDPACLARCSLLTAHCSLLTAHCSLLTAHCMVPAASRTSSDSSHSGAECHKRGVRFGTSSRADLQGGIMPGPPFLADPPPGRRQAAGGRAL
jgi:hypothetical protein